MPKKITFESIKASDEYKLWGNLFKISEEYKITESEFYNLDDLGGLFWEPFLDRLFRLGQMMKATKKLREIKMDWLRPILYFGSRSDGIVEFDGRHDVVDKGAIADATQLRFSFQHIINVVRDYENFNEENFKEVYKNLKKEVKSFFIKLNKYVRDSFRLMNAHVKLILKPLLDLRRSGYRLFSLEREELNYHDLTLFKDKNDLKELMKSTLEHFKWESFNPGKPKENNEELLKEFMEKDTKQSLYLYTFNNSIRQVKTISNPLATTSNFNEIKKTSKPKIYLGSYSKKKGTISEEEKKKLEEQKRRILTFPNIEILKQKEPTQLKHEAYQLKFEEGLASIYTYLIEKLPKRFPYEIDTHKIFVNINYIPNGKINEATNYYISQLTNQIELVKQKCYEMKLNGLSRVKMPITKNEDVVDILEKIFNLHSTMEIVMGNYLLYDQYMFIYNAIKFLVNSSVSEQIEKFKNKEYMEDAIPKYVFYKSMCHSVEVLEKMRNFYKEEIGRPFKFEDSYQLTSHKLEQGDNELFLFAYEIYGLNKRFYTEEIEKNKKIHDDEVKQFGRFWLMEGFFNKNDKDLWIEAIDLLSTINELVRDDIRDKFIFPKNDIMENNEKNNINSSQNDVDLNTSTLSKKSKMGATVKTKTSSNKLTLVKKSTKNIDKLRGNNTRYTKRKTSRKRTLSESETKKLPNDLNVFRPPKIWNFPYYRLMKLKYEKFTIDGGLYKAEIRNVEPNICYKDGRVERFNELFLKIFNNMKDYWRNEKGDIWDHFFTRVLKVFGINYISYKMQKEEEEKEKKEREELEKKRKEEEAKEEMDKKQLQELGLNKAIEEQIDKQARGEDERAGERKQTRKKTKKV